MTSTTVHDLKTLVQSMHALITIDSIEEERIDALLTAVAADLNMPYFAWSITTGLRRMPTGQAIFGTNDPVVLLKHLRSLTVEAIFHLKDIQSSFSNPSAVRALRETLQQYVRSRATIVLSGRIPSLPTEVAQFAVPVELKLPGTEELSAILSSVTHAMHKSHNICIELDAGGRDRVLQALSGLTLNQARQAVAWAMLDDGKLSADDVPRLARRKAELIRDGGLLEYLPPEDNRFELGGFGRLKAWLERARVGFGAEARALNLVFSLPPEFLRKGRFDEIFFVDLPDEQERDAILRIHLRLRKQKAEDLDLPALVAATEGFSGAEIEQAVIASLYRALAKKVPLTTAVLLEELRETIPLSVSRREDITRLRDLARGGLCLCREVGSVWSGGSGGWSGRVGHVASVGRSGWSGRQRIRVIPYQPYPPYQTFLPSMKPFVPRSSQIPHAYVR